MTPALIEPAIFRFVTQHFNHCATAVSPTYLHNEQTNAYLQTCPITYYILYTCVYTLCAPFPRIKECYILM